MQPATNSATPDDGARHLRLASAPRSSASGFHLIEPPPRINFTGHCVFCFRHGCESAACIGFYERAEWEICRSCDGSGFDAARELLCDCIGGVVDMAHSDWTRRVATRPPRLNFAGYCAWCNERWCNEERCIDRHTHSHWGVCDQCDGLGLDEATSDPCGCAYGLIESAFSSR